MKKFDVIAMLVAILSVTILIGVSIWLYKAIFGAVVDSNLPDWLKFMLLSC